MRVRRNQSVARLPERAHKTDAGLDLRSVNETTVPGLIGSLQEILNDFLSELASHIPGNLDYIEDKITNLNKCYQLVNTGISNAIPENHVGLVWDKSGLGSKGITILGGVIDEGYRGEIKVIVCNLGISDFEIEIGTKIAQYLVQPVNYVNIEETSDLDETERSVAGFGSTGE